ncbi:RNA polymerase [Schizosaccharomyces cryophilus OY26]|uniref:DNA-directed RNA polymerase n=1 Tax=Schizosaccharomyces cryophilus (strain OY26 / ATCC MYA-4695 / CBS 11777 / NBRC 106824 / NRRL Y48691) TaxID=653667 RepID=S9X2W4_SCHCR|nr:RNA polymerase [Schizosaccharomyces cryophilus OY26]EPY51427.1 RNA polymerase [Schizosaccharomyces cryophilus OY26]
MFSQRQFQRCLLRTRFCRVNVRGRRLIQTEPLQNAEETVNVYKPILPSKKYEFKINTDQKSEMVSLYEACVFTNDFVRSAQLLGRIANFNATDENMYPYIEFYLRHLINSEDFSLDSMIRTTRAILKKSKLPGNATIYAYYFQAALLKEGKDSGYPVLHRMAVEWRYRKGKVVDILSQTSILSSEQIQAIIRILNIPLETLSNSQLALFGFQSSNLTENDLIRNTAVKGESRLKPVPATEHVYIDKIKSKGMRLDALLKSLNNISTSPEELPVDEVSLEKVPSSELVNLARQKLLEKSSIASAIDLWKAEYEEIFQRGGALPKNKEASALFYQWFVELKELFNQENKRLDAFYHRIETNAGNPYIAEGFCGPFLKLLKADKLAALTIIEVIRSISSFSSQEEIEETHGVLISRLTDAVGRSFEREFLSERIQAEEREGHIRLRDNLKYVFNNPRAFRTAVKELRRNADENDGKWKHALESWPRYVTTKIGAIAISLFLQAAKMDINFKRSDTGESVKESVSAFAHTYQYIHGRKSGVLRPRVELLKLIASEFQNPLIHPQMLPMLVRPKPWVQWDKGGYYYSRESIIRLKGCTEQLDYVKEASRKGHLKKVYGALSALGDVSWRINRFTFDVIVKIWNSGEGMLSIPPKNVEVNLPPYPKQALNPNDRATWYSLRDKLTRDKATAHSQRCDFNYKLEIANSYLNERFYFPHNMDFRGRVYPMSAHLHHVNNDFCRGLLEFSEGKPLGPNGLNWLKVHLANLFGNSKVDYATRQKFVDDNIEEVFDSYDRPLDGRKWWTSAEDPFQALAAIAEIAKATRSENPETYVCHVPVQQDGTCNGLQHYAALGRDPDGAHEVNLSPNDRPKDVYDAVAKIVISKLEHESMKGDEMASALKDKIDRSVVKPTVMTNVYGVTYVGAKNQIISQLEKRGDIPKDMLNNYSSYLTKMVFRALRSLFERAHEIQDWLSTCSYLISNSLPAEYIEEGHKDKLTPTIWTTPLGFPIIQPYRNFKKRQVQTNLQSVCIEDRDRVASVEPRKQAAAFPPNFVHSLDATHLFMTCLKAKAANITFASVHDSYWTHACDVEKLGSLLREAFVELHSQKIMEKLRNEFRKRYKNYMIQKDVARRYDLWISTEYADKKWVPLRIPTLPSQGSFDLTKVLESKYFFS